MPHDDTAPPNPRDDLASLASLDPAALDAWLRAHLSRQAVAALLIAPSDASHASQTSATHDTRAATPSAAGAAAAPADVVSTAGLAAALRAYAEIRLLIPAPNAPGALLAAIAPLDPDILLLWSGDATTAADIGAADSTNATASANGDPAGDTWPRAVLTALDDLGLRDRVTILLLGPHADRATARRLGCEDGLPPDTPIALLAAYIAQAALANDDYRRRGSSPPCYL